MDTFKYTLKLAFRYIFFNFFLLAKIAHLLYQKHNHSRTLKQFGTNIITVEASKNKHKLLSGLWQLHGILYILIRKFLYCREKSILKLDVATRF